VLEQEATRRHLWEWVSEPDAQGKKPDHSLAHQKQTTGIVRSPKLPLKADAAPTTRAHASLITNGMHPRLSRART